MLIQRATLLDQTVVDIRVDDCIHEVAGALPPRSGEQVFDAALATVIPGLHDHHVHLHSAAAALASVRVGPPVHGRDELARALTTAPVGDDGWVRAVGYHESVAGDLDRATLDDLCPHVPVRVQHRSGVLWILNSAGLARAGMADHPDGRLRSADPTWSQTLQRNDTGLDVLSRKLAAFGVTGVTDATPDLDVAGIVRLIEAHRHGELAQRVHSLAPGKRILHDDRLDLDELTGWIADRHDAGGAVAVHCVTAAQLVVTMAALREAGSRPQDRIEHAAVVPDGCLTELAGLGVTVVTQPNFVAERGDQYLADIADDEQHELWRLATLVGAGIPVALSTDMPFGDGDPWAAMRAAVHRTTVSGAVLGGSDRVPAHTALTLFLGSAQRPVNPRVIAPGEPGDLCVLNATPAEVLCELDSEMVAATIVGGRMVFERS